MAAGRLRGRLMRDGLYFLIAGGSALVFCFVAHAQLVVGDRNERPGVFAGPNRQIKITLRNPANQLVAVNLRPRVYQTAVTTAAQLYERPAKFASVLPGQTVLETASLDFPTVRAVTSFVVQWLDDSNSILGKTEVLVYPTNLLAQFKTLAGGEPPGVFDPGNELQPLLRAQSVEFQDLIEDGTDKFHGKLAVFGPFASRQQMRESLAEDIRALAKRGVAVVWLQPPPGPRAPLKPSFYTVRVGDGAVVVAQGELVSRLAESPEAQLNLIRLAEAALRPEPLDLPEPQNSN